MGEGFHIAFSFGKGGDTIDNGVVYAPDQPLSDDDFLKAIFGTESGENRGNPEEDRRFRREGYRSSRSPSVFPDSRGGKYSVWWVSAKTSRIPRDAPLEGLIHDALANVAGVSDKPMFGGWAFLLHGKLLCGALQGSLILRGGPNDEDWALAVSGVEPVMMREHRKRGYIRATAKPYLQNDERQRLV